MDIFICLLWFTIGAIVSGLIMRRKDLKKHDKTDRTIYRWFSMAFWPVAIFWVLSVTIETIFFND